MIQASNSQDSFLPSIDPKRILFDSKVGSFQGPEREEEVEAGLSVPLGPITKATWAGGPLAARGSRTARKMPVSCEGLINRLLPLPGNGLVGSRLSSCWHSYVDSEAGATADVFAAVCAFVLRSICVGVHGCPSCAEQNVCVSSS